MFEVSKKANYKSMNYKWPESDVQVVYRFLVSDKNSANIVMTNETLCKVSYTVEYSMYPQDMLSTVSLKFLNQKIKFPRYSNKTESLICFDSYLKKLSLNDTSASWQEP